MLHRREVCGWLTLSLMIIALPVTLLGATANPKKPQTVIATLEVGPTRIDWLPEGDYESLVLTVAGPGDLFIRQESGLGQRPFLGLVDSKGEPLPDGIYSYELRGLPLRVEGKLQERRLVQSGYFSIREGSFVDPVQRDPSGKPSTVKPPLSDVTEKAITQGNECIGGSCVTGDDNFFVLKLKHHTVGIKFEDVFDGISYDRDWMIRTNPFGVGDVFRIEDADAGTAPFTIEGNAPDHSLYVRNNGNLGLGTSTPATRLDVKASGSGQVAARLQNTSATGHSGIHYLDQAGNIDLYFGIDNAASTTRLDSVNNNPILILTNSVERMRVTSAGNVGIGTSSPGARLDVKENSSGAVGWIQNTSATGLSGLYYFNNSGLTTSFLGTDNVNSLTRFDSFNNYPIIFLTNYNERMRINPSGNVGINCWNPTSDLVVASGSGCSTPTSSMNAGDSVFTTSSSRTIKENLEPVSVPSILEKISAIDVYKYDFIGGPKDRLGLMAEDFHQVFQRGSDKLINGQEVEMALWLAVKELTAQNKALTVQNQEISKRLAELEARLTVEPGDTSK